MNKDDIKELMSFFDEQKSINKLKIKDKLLKDFPNYWFEIEIKKYGADGENLAPQIPVAPQPAPSVNVVVNEKSSSKATTDTIDSPMVGTFYKAPSPGANAFVSVGQVVHKGETIGIIEAMKIMNEIEAEFDCRIKKALVEDGQPVEYAMALFEVEKL